MISAWWLLVAFFVGGWVGVIGFALLVMAKRTQ